MHRHQTYHDPQKITRLLQNCRTIAVVGLSSRAERAGYYVPAYLQAEGYRIIPVNPRLTDALGEKAYPTLIDIPFRVDLVLIFRKSEAVLPIVEQAIQIEAQAVWMQLGISNQRAANLAEQAGVAVIMDACMMVEHRMRRHSFDITP